MSLPFSQEDLIAEFGCFQGQDRGRRLFIPEPQLYFKKALPGLARSLDHHRSVSGF